MAVGKNELVLELGKHFLIIDSNKSFILEDNQGFRAYRPAGAWQIDCWKLLPAEWHKIYPVYMLKIEWENTEADKDYIPTINATDLDLGDGIAGVSGQPVNITTPVTVANLPNVIVGEQNTVPVHIETNLQPLEVVSHANNTIDGFKWIELLTNSETGESVCDYLFRAFGGEGIYHLYIENFFAIKETSMWTVSKCACKLRNRLVASRKQSSFSFCDLVKVNGVYAKNSTFNANEDDDTVISFGLFYKIIEEQTVPDDV